MTCFTILCLNAVFNYVSILIFEKTINILISFYIRYSYVIN